MKKLTCEAKTELCSGQGVRHVSVNGSEKQVITFRMCLACRAYLGRTARIKDAKTPGRQALGE